MFQLKQVICKRYPTMHQDTLLFYKYEVILRVSQLLAWKVSKGGHYMNKNYINNWNKWSSYKCTQPMFWPTLDIALTGVSIRKDDKWIDIYNITPLRAYPIFLIGKP